jgi:hypothetical protein
MITSEQERREYQRMAVDAPVQVRGQGGDYTGICRDLSATGMLVEFSTIPLHQGQKVMITLASGSDALPPLRAEAVVLRLEEEFGHVAFDFTSLV